MRTLVLCILGLIVADICSATAQSPCDLRGAWQCQGNCSPNSLARIEPKYGDNYWFTNEHEAITSAVYLSGRMWRTRRAPGWSALTVIVSRDCNTLDFEDGNQWVRYRPR